MITAVTMGDAKQRTRRASRLSESKRSKRPCEIMRHREAGRRQRERIKADPIETRIQRLYSSMWNKRKQIEAAQKRVDDHVVKLVQMAKDMETLKAKRKHTANTRGESVRP